MWKVVLYVALSALLGPLLHYLSKKSTGVRTQILYDRVTYGSARRAQDRLHDAVDGRAISAGPPLLGSIASRPAGLRSAGGGQG
jgi:hypothetical protein